MQCGQGFRRGSCQLVASQSQAAFNYKMTSAQSYNETIEYNVQSNVIPICCAVVSDTTNYLGMSRCRSQQVVRNKLATSCCKLEFRKRHDTTDIKRTFARVRAMTACLPYPGRAGPGRETRTPATIELSLIGQRDRQTGR